MPTASVFLSHTHVDKPFVRRLGADLAALGAQVWIDEAELRVGDSLLTKISKAIDDMEYLAVVLSPDAVASSWVQNELEQAMSGQLERDRVKVLPIYYRRVPFSCTSVTWLGRLQQAPVVRAVITMLCTWGCGWPCGPRWCSKEAATQRWGLAGENLLRPASCRNLSAA